MTAEAAFPSILRDRKRFRFASAIDMITQGPANQRQERALREKELRIALVCFGGVSLAVYMHGITKEILKLVRASSAVHAITDRAKRRVATFFDVRDENDPEYDTEAVYFDLLREIGRNVELRVVVDIIAGASAGGINGTMLARALSHDLPMGALRDLWLDNADVTELLAPDARAGELEQVVHQAVDLGGRRPANAGHRATRRCARSCRCSCGRAGSSRRSTGR